MNGVVLAAGGGTRLRPLTDTLPKTLLTVTEDGKSVLELAIANLAAVDIREITVVSGHAREAIGAQIPTLAARYDVTIQERFNDRFADWNNAYSVWLVRDLLAAGAMMINGDTVHPVDVERRLLDARGQADILIAIDDDKALGEEEMKVLLRDGVLERISKLIDPMQADGEYIGVTLVEPAGAEPLAQALHATFTQDPSQWYEDGYQHLVDGGGVIRGVPIGANVAWIEIDDHDDLAGARALTRTDGGNVL